ncbi:CRE-INS-12 protein [Caenorhabditis remanei]|uniref:CRE-INS-12 protein n=1 Tax=Caenorhabditis remanei TaxID=31234 RepID=E3M4Q7_CAERE|nr:CRE-INS-12 protein [Caenorhabditis remanei]
MRSLFVLLVVFIAVVALFGESDGAPSHHKKHSKCTEKLYTALRSLCSYRGESEFLRTSASKCCQSNCDLSEMMTMCVVAPNFEDDIIS